MNKSISLITALLVCAALSTTNAFAQDYPVNPGDTGIPPIKMLSATASPTSPTTTTTVDAQLDSKLGLVNVMIFDASNNVVYNANVDTHTQDLLSIDLKPQAQYIVQLTINGRVWSFNYTAK